MEQVGPVKRFRVARSIGGRGLYVTSCYWVNGLLVDSGCAHASHELMAALDGLPVHTIVNTHSHEDHIGANGPLQDAQGPHILAHSLAVPVLAKPRERQPLRPYQRIMWGYPPPCLSSAIGDVVETARHRFEVIETPGHSRDHICLYEPEEGWIFTGDAFVGGKDRILRADYDIWRIIASLEKIAMLQAEVLFCAGGRIRTQPRDQILEKIDYLKEMGERVLLLYGQGMSYRRIRRVLLGPEMAIAYFTLGHFSGENLVRSFVVDRPAHRE
jgi:glyoxylase-like metal-dependent hydrolase (beta-lactamase superfamily II)